MLYLLWQKSGRLWNGGLFIAYEQIGKNAVGTFLIIMITTTFTAKIRYRKRKRTFAKFLTVPSITDSDLREKSNFMPMLCQMCADLVTGTFCQTNLIHDSL